MALQKIIITSTTKIMGLVINLLSTLLRYSIPINVDTLCSILAREILVVVNILYVVDKLIIFSWPILNSSGFRLSYWVDCVYILTLFLDSYFTCPMGR